MTAASACSPASLLTGATRLDFDHEPYVVAEYRVQSCQGSISVGTGLSVGQVSYVTGGIASPLDATPLMMHGTGGTMGAERIRYFLLSRDGRYSWYENDRNLFRTLHVNSWAVGDNVFFFSHGMAQGFWFGVPRDGRGPGLRMIFQGVSTTEDEHGVRRPRANQVPDQICVMYPVGGAGPPAAAAPPPST